MNPAIEQLYRLASKPYRLIVGLMSGTSLDGLDIALCKIEGHGLDTKIELLQFETVPYNTDFKNEIKNIFSKREIDLEKLCLLNPWIACKHAQMINTCLLTWKVKNNEVDLIASHGQTVYHAPKRLHQQLKFGNATLQIGDGDHLAVATGIITISDFRQKNIAVGGEGAPLAVYGDYLLFGKQGEARVLLNIGGIANFTYLPGNHENIICTDVGPGNTLMDAYLQQQFPGRFFDTDARIAQSGVVHENLLSALKDNDFFKQDFPKTTGPELFNLQYLKVAKQKSNTVDLSGEDTMATLNRFSADMIAIALRNGIKDLSATSIYCSGGGIHNPLLMQHLKAQLPECVFNNTDDMGISPDAKEAVLFALLANECICSDVLENKHKIPGIPTVAMGKISLPL